MVRMMGRRATFAIALGVVMLGAAPAHAQSPQEWPTGTVTIVVPFAAGATPDSVARILADKLKARTGKTFIIENKPGAGGNTGTAAVAKAAPDGLTLGVSILGPLAMNTVLMKSMPYNPATDIAPVAMISLQPSVLAVSNAFGVSDLKSLFDKLRADPGKYNFASIGRGSLSHLSMELIAARSGTKVTHVPYTSSPQAALAVTRNDVQMTVLPAISVLPLAKDGQMKILAVTSARRSAALPDTPTFAEAGIDGVEASAWNALIAPGATPPALVAVINAHVNAALADPDLREKFAAQVMEPAPMSPAQLKQYIADEFARWSAVVKAAGIEPQ